MPVIIMMNDFYSKILSGEMHDVLRDEYNFTEEELDILDYIVVPSLRNHVDLSILESVESRNGKAITRIDPRKTFKYAKKILPKLYYAFYDISNFSSNCFK